MLENKKISSQHCKIIFLTEEGQPGYQLQISAESRNKTFIGDVEIQSSATIPFSGPVDIAFVFPLSENPVEKLRISPLSESRELDPEDKRWKKEMRQLEKEDAKWNHSYGEDIKQLVEQEASLLKGIEQAERLLLHKQGEVGRLKSEIHRAETEMAMSEEKLKLDMEGLREDHKVAFAQLSAALTETIGRLGRLEEEKLKLQMNL